jgi:hypothetical protein
MKILSSLLFILVLFVIYDYNSYDTNKKIKNIQINSKLIDFHKVQLNFKSNQYKEFVYAK